MVMFKLCITYAHYAIVGLTCPNPFLHVITIQIMFYTASNK